ncbi:hypothetical protein M8J76_004568 [Diaphorina citri]|nr:hypothetical protein M8J75_008369 [Diaphorina citri]KAI5736553.1 hypothetical protein M8J76_004568 [Diaphorina citri]
MADEPSDKKVKSYGGIPEAVFVDDVDKYMSLPENDRIEVVLKKLDEEHNKYKFMEYSLIAKRRRLKEQIPDLERSLQMINLMKKHQENDNAFDTQFLLSNHLYMKASIPPTDKVCLWLGANVMLEYNLTDATALVQKNIEAAKKNLSYIEHDLDFLRDQFTTTEVNMARVYNWDVKRRNQLKMGLEKSNSAVD